MSAGTDARADMDALYRRADIAASEEERAECLCDIEVALTAVDEPWQRARLLMCRTRVRSSRWQTREVLQDALAAMSLFEEAGDTEGALEAASLGAAFASRLGEMSLAAELATGCILSIDFIAEDNVVAEVANRLGIFCYSFLDYDRAIEQFEVSLAAAERCGDTWVTCRQLHNIAEALLLAVRQDKASGQGDGRYDRFGADRLAKAEQVVQRLVEEATEEIKGQLGVQRLQAELLVELGRPAEALGVLQGAAGGSEAIVWAAGRADAKLTEARCLRALGRSAEAVAAASNAAQLAEGSDDLHDTMLILDELVAAEQEAGDLDRALADALELKRRIWAIHRRQTGQVVEQVWARAALEQERRSLEAQTAAAIRSAEEDALTRIGNRRLIERVLGDVAENREHLALLMADIDHFKKINDTFGHEVGDHVLRALGHILASDARAGQIVVRYGGEEFVYALPSVELAAARDFAERIRMKVRSYPWGGLDPRLVVTVSIGVACGPAGSWRSVLAAADRALYLAKRRGRNRVEVAQRVGKRTA
jgi:diguanylate cyclase (GGDEF)-like protein